MTGGPLPYLNVAGVEIANAARTLSYLRGGLANTGQGRWELGGGDLCSVLYRLDGHGDCAHPAVFINPSVDPAPWYDPSEPGSSTFLGVVLLDLQGYDSTIVRSATNRLAGLGGGTLSAQYRRPRIWKFRGAMISADDAGAEFGLRWLTSALQTTECDTCETGALTIRLVCPPADCSNDELGEWISYQAALTDGPHEVEPFGPSRLRPDTDVLAGCRDWVTVEWTITAGNPFLYKRPQVCLPETELTECDYGACTDICDFLFGAGDAPCCVVEPPLRGVLGGIFTISSESGFGELLLESRADCGDDDPLLALRIAEIPAGTTVTVNSANHTFTVTDNTTGVATDGQYLIDLEAGETIEWIEIANCESAVCICVRPTGGSAGQTATVTVETQLREG